MINPNFSMPILLTGLIIVSVIFVRIALLQLKIPALIGYILLGFLIQVLDFHFGFVSEQTIDVFNFLANIGIITLLFRIGLESNLKGLFKQLHHASIIWIVGVTFNGTLGFLVSRLVLGIPLIPSLFIGTALTATSVGIPVGIWRRAGAIRSRRGALLIDVAELNDIFAIVSMILLFTIAPILNEKSDVSLFPIIVRAITFLLIKLFLFGTFCVLISLYVERRLTHSFKQITKPPNPILVVTGIGFCIAAVAGLIGFPLAIGAFFAGLVFSRDPDAVKLDISFDMLYDFFGPFFFIGIGFNVTPNDIMIGLFLGVIIFSVAVFGNLIGQGIPAFFIDSRNGIWQNGWMSFLLFGISVIPRAEIAMIIMQRGLHSGNWAVSSKLFNGMVVVSLLTCLTAPIVIRFLLRKWPQPPLPVYESAKF